MPGLLRRLESLVPGFRAPRAGPLAPPAPNFGPLPPALPPPRPRAAVPPAAARTTRPRPSSDERVPDSPFGGAGTRQWFLPYADDTSTNDTPEIRHAMRLMIRDPVVKAGWLSQVLTVLAQEFQVHPDPSDKNSTTQEQSKFVRHALENADGEMVGVAGAIIMNLGSDGYTLAEKVYRYERRGRYEGKYTLEALKPKDPDNVMICGDRFGNVTGVKSVLGGRTFPISDFTYVRYLHTFNEPFGMAAFRPSYGAYWMRDTVRKLRAIHVEKKSSGFLIGEYDEPSDQGVVEAALTKARNSTWMAIPTGMKIRAEQLSTASEPDYKSFDESLREEILIGVAMAHLHILQGGVTDARGDTKVHKAVSDLGPWLLTYLVQLVLNRQVIPDLIDYNYPEVTSYPRITLGGVTNGEILEMLQVLSGAQAAGFKPSKSHYAPALTIQEADPDDPDDQLNPPGQQQPGGMPGMPGMPPPGMPGMPPPPGGAPPGAPPPPPGGLPPAEDPFGDSGGGDPFEDLFGDAPAGGPAPAFSEDDWQ